MNEANTQDLTEQLANLLQSRGLMLATAESCTGGLIAAACTERSGSSLWFERGFVTYSNESKSELLGVPLPLIAQHGAVSQAVAQAMAQAWQDRAEAAPTSRWAPSGWPGPQPQQ
jgi:nicotinamide-nucleotide amidase